jgi:hypothetical protein
VATTVDSPVIDSKDWAAVQELIAEVQQADKYSAAIYLFDATVRLFRNIESRDFIAKTPTPRELKQHEAFLRVLIGVGQLLELRIQNIDDTDLAAFGIQRENFSAYVRELEESFLMWHGPELDPNRAAELEKVIFGA